MTKNIRKAKLIALLLIFLFDKIDLFLIKITTLEMITCAILD